MSKLLLDHPVFQKQNIVTGGQGNEIMVFDSVPKFIDMVKKHNYFLSDSFTAEWCGDTYDDAFRFSELGDNRLVPTAESVIEKLRTTLPDIQPSWTPDIAGDHVVVPEFISGIPEHMRRKIPNETTSSPIKIVFDTMSSAAIHANDLKNRGTTVLALLMRMIAERPVEFWIANAYSTSPEVGIMIRVPTAPLNLAMAAYLITCVAFTRNFMYTSMTSGLRWNGSWPNYAFTNQRGHGEFANDTSVIEATRKFFGLAPHDIIVPVAIHSSYTDMWQNPVKWINERLQEGRDYDPE